MDREKNDPDLISLILEKLKSLENIEKKLHEVSKQQAAWDNELTEELDVLKNNMSTLLDDKKTNRKQLDNMDNRLRKVDESVTGSSAKKKIHPKSSKFWQHYK